MTQTDPSLRYSLLLRTLRPLNELYIPQRDYHIELSPQMRHRIAELRMEEDDVKSLTLTLFAGLDQNYPNSGWTSESRLDLFRRALAEEPCFLDVNALCSRGQSSRSFLHDMRFCYDSSQEASDLLDLLLEHGADPNLLSSEGLNAIGYSAYSSHKLARRLFEAGCSLNHPALSDGDPFEPLPDLRETAMEQLVQITAKDFDVEQTTLRQLLYVANIEKLALVMNPARWKGHEVKAIELIGELHPYLQAGLESEHLSLIQTAYPPSPIVNGWNASISTLSPARPNTMTVS